MMNTGYAYSTAISADGEYIVTGGISDKKVYLFDKILQLQFGIIILALWSGRVIAISANGSTIVVATR